MITTIAVIGAPASLGSAIAARLAKSPYRVLLVREYSAAPGLNAMLDRLEEKIQGDDPPPCIGRSLSARDASWEADLILLAVPYELQEEVASRIHDVVTGKIIVSMSNPMNISHDGNLALSDTSAAEELAKLLPHARVVKAFNTLFPRNFRVPLLGDQRTDVFVAGDDPEAVACVTRLAREAGFNPLSAGRLAMSRVLESMAILLISLSVRNGFRGLIGWKVLHEPMHEDHMDRSHRTQHQKACRSESERGRG